MYQVTLYYNFCAINDPDDFCKQHLKKCKELGLKGRVYVSSEGINGTLAGDEGKVARYKAYLLSLEGLEKTEFKDDCCDYIPFVKLIVKTRDEIVALKTKERLDPHTGGGEYLEPKEWRKILENEQDYVLLDVRNDYESKVGHFQGATRPDVENFYDFPDWLERTLIDKNKKIMMYCTGGIRCEKFSVLMKRKGFKDVRQLHGGIINYAQKEGGSHFKGKCFVFDDRLTVPVNPDDQAPLTRCEITQEPCDRYLNCANPDCNKLFICSEEGAKQMEGCCSQECMKSPRRRPFNPDDIYTPTRKWYHYFDEKI